MPATFIPVPRTVPSNQRAAVVTDVEAGDELDFLVILGRPARLVKILPDSDADTITMRLNNRITFNEQYGFGGAELGQNKPSTFQVVSKGEHYPLYELTAEQQYYTEEGVDVAFMQIEAANNPFTVYAW